MAIKASIKDLLRRKWPQRIAPKVPAQPVALSAEGRDIFVVSDLHLADGVGSDGRYEGTENFFADSSFQRFLKHAHKHLAAGRQALLIINGDFVDFMRIMHVPEKKDRARWAHILAKLGMPMTEKELAASISKKERRHGLKTNDFKSVWKLERCVAGHGALFEALADWVERGHRLVIVRGNHDLEWHWPAVRKHLRLALAERIAASAPRNLATVLEQTVLPNVDFIHHSAVLDNELYIEHGHQYDKLTAVVGEPVLNNGKELNIPFGSFFNRYLINHIELDYPFLDNVRPRESLLPLLVRERFFLAMRLLFQHVPLVFLTISKRYYRYLLRRVLVMGLVVGGPVVIMLWQLAEVLAPLFTSGNTSEASGIFGFLQEQGWNLARQFAWLAISYFLARLVAYFQLEQPETLAMYARERLGELDCSFITFGHTHNPDQFEEEGRWFYNTGTWIPIIEHSNAAIRLDKTYTFLHLPRDATGKLAPNVLQRWDDPAGRVVPMTLVKRKGSR